MVVRFVFLQEGSSDTALVRPLEDLCISAGAREVVGMTPDLSLLPTGRPRTLAARMEAVLTLEPSANVLFVHRDSDSRDPQPRYDEIREAGAGLSVKPVCIIPVRESETWALVDESLIRSVSENPRGRVRLIIPSLTALERAADPKRILMDALVTASELRGRRLEKFRKTFNHRRRMLLERIDINGPINQLPAWGRLIKDLTAAVQNLDGIDVTSREP